MVKHGSRGHGSQAPVGKSVAVQAPLPLTGGPERHPRLPAGSGPGARGDASTDRGPEPPSERPPALGA